MKIKQTECSETSAYKIQTPGNYPEETIKKYAFAGNLKPIFPLQVSLPYFIEDFRCYPNSQRWKPPEW